MKYHWLWAGTPPGRFAMDLLRRSEPTVAIKAVLIHDRRYSARPVGFRARSSFKAPDVPLASVPTLHWLRCCRNITLLLNWHRFFDGGDGMKRHSQKEKTSRDQTSGDCCGWFRTGAFTTSFRLLQLLRTGLAPRSFLPGAKSSVRRVVPTHNVCLLCSRWATISPSTRGK